MEENRLIVVDENGKQVKMEILFNFVYDKKYKKQYVLYTNPEDEEGQVFASSYDDEGHLFPVEDEEEWNMIEEVYGAFVDEFGEEE